MRRIASNRGMYRGNTSSSKKKYHFIDRMRMFDMFGQPLPTFNVRGEEFLKTKFGAFVTMLLLTSIIMYGMLKFIQMESRANANISEYEERQTFDQNNPINQNQIGFRMAFAMRSFSMETLKYEFKNDV